MKINLPLKIEIPNTQAEFELGLMFRESLEEDTGMLFAFAENGEHSFHMRHTTIPLDIAFITEEGVIESIKEFGLLKGSFLGLKRILSCHPIKVLGGGEGFDPIKKKRS